MKIITLRIKKNYALKLLKDLERSEAISVVPKKAARKIRRKKTSKKEGFFLSAGLWKDRNITLDDIRTKAFPIRK